MAIDHGLVKDTILLAANEELSLRNTTPPGKGRKKRCTNSGSLPERKDTRLGVAFIGKSVCQASAVLGLS